MSEQTPFPRALAEQACTISKRGTTVTIECDDADEANELLDWLNEIDADLETAALERAIDRMGWPEIHAFQARLDQDVYEDAGGFWLRKIKRLFGINRDPVLTYREAAHAMLDEHRRGIELGRASK